MLRLHSFCQSGNAFKVAFMLRALGLPWQAVHVDFMNGVTRTPAWRDALNPMGEVPVLEFDDGRQMTQSGAILLHLADTHGAFGGADANERQEVLRWLFFDNHKFTANFATFRFLKSFAPAASDPAVLAFMRGRVEAAYAIVDKHLATRHHIVGAAPTIADFSLSGYVFFPKEESGIDVDKQYPNIAAWRDRLKALPCWADPYDILPGERIAPKW